MHSACQIGNARMGHSSRQGQSAPVGVKLMYDSSALWMKLFERADPTEKHEARAINRLLFAGPASYSPVRLLFQHFQCAGNQRIDAIFNIGLLVEQLDVDWYALTFVAHHVS
jgi:hypothetical protein